jgi:vacuolar-type H+-ATPase subunit H
MRHFIFIAKNLLTSNRTISYTSYWHIIKEARNNMSEEVQELMHQTSKEIGSQDEQVVTRRNKKKIKATLRKDRKIDRSIIACDAIQMLYEKECLEASSN